MNRPLRSAAALGLALVLTAPGLDAQTEPRPLTHDDYDVWHRIAGETLSDDGAWLAWVVTPGEGNTTLMARSLERGSQIGVPRGSDPVFTGGARFVVARLAPDHETVQDLRREGKKGDDLPPDSVVVVDLQRVFAASTPDLAGVWHGPGIVSLRVPERGAFVAYRLKEPKPESDKPAEGEAEEPEEEEEEGEDENEAPRTDPGSTLVLRDLVSGAEHRFPWATDYRFTEDGRFLYYAASSPEGEDDGVWRVSTADGTATPLIEGDGRYLGLSVQPEGHRVTFVSDRDDRAAEQPAFTLYVAGPDGTARAVADAAAEGLPQGWWIGDNAAPSLSKSGRRVFVGVAPRPAPEPDEKSLDDERVVVDVWNWKDPYLQPMQLVQADDEKKRTFRAWVPFDGGRLVQLETPEVPDVRVGSDGDAALGLGLTDLPYRQLISWDGRYVDAWVVDVATGQRRLVAESLRGGASLSPDARWVTWWDGTARAWFARSVDGGPAVDMTASLPHPVYDLLDDHPQPPPPYGSAGWLEGEDRFVVYDEHDLWAVDPAGEADPVNLTDGVGRREGLRFRWVRLDSDAEHVPAEGPVLLSAFHLTTKQDGFWRDRFDRTSAPERLVMADAALSNPRKAEDADRYLFTRETFRDFPDLYVSGPDFRDPEKVTSLNVEQRQGVRWGTAELVEWTSNDGIPLQGILYKPDGFDPAREYPMMVYFYERMSDGLHRHHVPAAGGSSINFSFYVSRGYLVFVPDIPYEIGHPGESALDAVVPGVLALIDEGFVDADRIGVQGHSWGGYQIAWMLTRTNLFAAAEAGAPVANMTSAYGGIRWGSGMSRMFQYERTQSRIGGTLWETPLLYIENSPLFAADKITTPLLMMHNDEDTAVPWEQGIEMFVALRRLQKPVWLLNYNGEPHGLRRDANREDWAMRMQQFFDHYLMDAPAPVWMEEGVPAVLKGTTLGLELVTETTTTEQGGGN